MSKPAFAPIPARAMADERLSALDFRVLMAIGIHDRLGANGVGCFASPRRMADLIGSHEKSVSRSIGLLIGAGYLVAAPATWDRRRRIYRIVYTDFDKAFLRSKIGNETATDQQSSAGANGNDLATGFDSIGNDAATENHEIGNKPNRESQRNQADGTGNILVESHLNKSCKAGKNSAKVGNPERLLDNDILPAPRSIEEATGLLREMLEGREISPYLMSRLRQKLLNGKLTRAELGKQLQDVA